MKCITPPVAGGSKINPVRVLGPGGRGCIIVKIFAIYVRKACKFIFVIAGSSRAVNIITREEGGRKRAWAPRRRFLSEGNGAM